MSKTSYKNLLNAKRLSLIPIAKDMSGNIITYAVYHGGKKVKNIANGIKPINAEVKTKGKKDKAANANSGRNKAA